MGHALRLVVVVVVGRGHRTGGTLVLTNRPVLEVVVAPVDQADFVVTSVTVQCTLAFAARTRVVAAVVLEDLSWRGQMAATQHCVGPQTERGEGEAYIVLALAGPSVDGKVEVTRAVHSAGEVDGPGLSL